MKRLIHIQIMTMRSSFIGFILSVFFVLQCMVNAQKVEICHIPPGNPENAHTISVNINALQAHLNHGDYEGPCNDTIDGEPNDTIVVEPNDTIVVEPDSTGMDNNLQFALSVFPNPYSGYANINYTLPENGSVLMTVYSQSGNNVQTIVNTVQVAGIYSYSFSAVSLGYSPGYYLLSFTFWGSQTISETITLLEL